MTHELRLNLVAVVRIGLGSDVRGGALNAGFLLYLNSQ